MDKRVVHFYSEGSRLEGDLFLPSDLRRGEKRPGIVICHGFTGLRELVLPDYAKVFTEAGYVSLIFDYRGFGRSTDELPSEPMVYEDSRAAWTWLAHEHPDSPRYIFGHSLGGAIAVQLASEVTDARGLIVEGTFTSIPDVFQSMKWGWLPVTALITQRFDSLSKIERVKVPVLVVHGSRDSLIRPALGRALFERASAQKKFVLVDGGTHYSTNGKGQAQYREALRELYGLRL